MRPSISRICILLTLATTPCLSLLGQVATGTYDYGTFDNLGFDTVNVGNLNVHFAIPVLNKTGRGLPFDYNLSYDSSVWYPVLVNGSTVWTPVQFFGWTQNGGYLTYQTQTVEIGGGGHRSGECIYTDYTDWIYTGPFGTSHQFWGQTSLNNLPSNCGADVSSITLSAEDGSGYQLNLTSYTKGTIVAPDGTTFAVSNGAIGPAVDTDSNGNEISVDGNGHFTDTTGNVVLTVSGTAPSPQKYVYKDTSGNSQTVTVTYQSYTVQTDFGCSGIGEYGPTSVPLVKSISLPDGTSYGFTYEATPNGSGNVTGRIASITLRTGGTISYAYSGGSNGIECVDGSTAGITRTIAANAGSSASTYTYTRTTGTNTTHTEKTDGLGNHSQYDFVQASNQTTGATTTAQYYETNRNVFEGQETGSPLIARQTCYNGEAQSCTTESFTIPISEIDVYETLNGIEEHGSTAKYNSNGLQTDQYIYDFGTSSSRGALLSHEVWTYGGNLASEVTADQTYDGSGNLASQTTYGYDSTSLTTSSGVPQHVSVTGPRGNLTAVNAYTSSSTSLSSSNTYEDTGSLLTSITPDGTTSYSYDSTFVYATGTTPPTPSSGVPLPLTEGFDTANTGLLTSQTDANSQEVSVAYADPLLRPTSIQYPDGGHTGVAYDNANQTSIYQYQSSSAYADTENLLDSYARQSRIAHSNGQSTDPWYQQDTCYDADGNISFQSYNYQGGGWGTTKACSSSQSAGDSYTYDALGRALTVTHADSTSISYSYSGRATKVVNESGSTRVNQVDGLGRITNVCEVTSTALQSSGSPAACGLDIAATGYLTTYTYSLSNHTTTVSQGAQTRTFQTDWLSRPTSVQEPESGTTSYSYAYNSTGLAVTRVRPQANQFSASTKTTTTYQYDVMGRILSVSYTDSTPGKTYAYDVAQYWGLNLQNPKGRLVYQESGGDAASVYSYDALGRVLSLWECTPYMCGKGAYAASYTYDWLGNLLSAGDGAGVTASYSYDVANEVTQITSSLNDSHHPGTLVSSVQSGPFGPLTWNLGNGLTGVHTYDSLGRISGGWVCNGSSQPGCTGATQLYGFTSSWQGTHQLGGCDTVLNQCLSFGYDVFDRLTSRTVTQGTAQNFQYVYDRWGNRWQQNVTGGSGPSPQLSFNTSNNQISSSGYVYDAAGNLNTDGIHTYSYDADGNMLSVDSGNTASYVYDALNQRLRINTAGSDAQEFFYNPSGRRTSIWDGTNGSLDQGQAYWGSMPIEFYADSVAHFQHQDWLGTERIRTTYNGATEGTFASLPFGDDLTYGSDYDPYHFAQMDHDYGSATDHAQFRQYTNVSGRWMSPDPYAGSYDFSSPQSLNRYSYVLDAPLSYVDPLGLVVVPCPPGTDPSIMFCINTTTGALPLGAGSGGGYEPGAGAPCPASPTQGRCVNTPPVIIRVVPGGGKKKGLFTCASEAAAKVSIAGLLQSAGIGTSGVSGFITNALGGNVFSGATDLIQSFGNGEGGGHSVFYNMGQGIVAGPTQGFGSAFGSSIEGTPWSSGPADVATTAILGGVNSAINSGGELVTLAGEVSTAGLTAGEYASGVGEIKLGYDLLTYAGSLAGCAAGIVH